MRTSALARVTATTTLAEARADVSSTCSRDGDDDAGGKAPTDVGSTCSHDGDNDGGGGGRGHQLSLA